MRKVTESYLKDRSAAYREAIVATSFPNGERLQRFPNECCDIAAKMLGLHLFASLRVESTMIRGRFFSFDVTHCWLQIGDMVIDITARQFGAEFPPTICERDPLGYQPNTKKTTVRIDGDYLQEVLTSDRFAFLRCSYCRVRATLDIAGGGNGRIDQ